MNIKRIEAYPYVLDVWNEFVQKNPERICIIDELRPEGYRRAQIDEEASRIYAYLKENHIGREDFVMICLPRGRKIFSAMLGVWKAGAALTVVDDHYAEERIESIYDDCDCKLKISEENWENIMNTKPLKGHEPVYNHDACFAVYTSGSTGKPKGVLHEYGKLALSQITSIPKNRPNWDEDSIVGVVSPLNFVAAVKLGVCGFYEGYTIDIVPINTVKNPVRLRKYFLEHKITDTFFSPSVIRATGGSFGPYLKRVITGSESSNGITFEGAMLINNYGMSEASIVVAQYIMDKKEEIVPIGKPLSEEVNILLLDENDNPVEDGKEGEICFENPYFRGYINMPEETSNVLRNGIFHTNDVGVKREDGNYVIVGRKNEMIKINGNRVEPAEIEAQARNILDIDWCAVKGFSEPDGAFLCFYYKADMELDIQDFKTKLGEKLPYYMIPSYYIKLDEIPLLPNNKVNKKALPKPERKGAYTTEYIAPSNEMEEKLCRAFANVLGRERIGVKDDFFQSGGDSIKVMQVLAEIDDELLEAMDFYQGSSAENIAKIYYDKKNNDQTYEEYEINARKDTYGLTDIQTSMAYMTYMTGKANSLNLMPALYVIEDVSDINRIKEVVNKVIRHYPVFSTRITIDENRRFWQKYDETQCMEVEVEKITEEKFRSLIPELLTPILNLPETYRLRLFETDKCGYLYMNKTHAISDGMTRSMMLKAFDKVYHNEPLETDIYYSYLKEREKQQQSEKYLEDKEYFENNYLNKTWKCQIDGDIDEDMAGDIPKDRKSEPAAPAEKKLTVTKEQIDIFQKATGLTSNHLCNLAVLLTMAKYTNSKETCISYTYNNRNDKIKENALGCLFLMFPLGIRLDEYNNVKDMLEDVKKRAFNNIKHSYYEQITSKMAVKTGTCLSITYETQEILDSNPLANIGMHEEYIEQAYIEPSTTDALIILDCPDGITIQFMYNSAKKSRNMAENIVESINDFVNKIVNLKNPELTSIEEFMRE